MSSASVDSSSVVPIDAPDRFARWAATADAVRATSKRLEKLAALAAYLPTLNDDSLVIACRFFAGIVFARHDMRTTQVGGAIVWTALAEVTGASEELLGERYLAHGDTGDLVGELLADRPASTLDLSDIAMRFDALATAKGSLARRALVAEAFRLLGGEESRFFVKLLGGELRIGLKEAQVEEAIARAFEVPLDQVRRATLLRGDVGEVALLARRGALEEARLALFHPIGFMLAQPLETPEEIVAALPSPFMVEDKYDGIRAQAHVQGDEVRLYSRTLDEITRGYPDVVHALRGLGDGLVLDGELLAVDPADPARARPFKDFQRRLGRKAPSATLMEELPAAFFAYDLLAAPDETGAPALVVDEPWERRRARLAALVWPERGARLAPARAITSADELESAFAAARAAGNEGVMAKDPASPYTPGRRGKSWVKLKRALATLDVVVTGAERGHGKRKHWLSDYTFAVRASETDPTLLNVGKAYSGLTDAEIEMLTARFTALTEERHGPFHRVRPEVVLEVTFDIVQRSARHKAGYALRFPRIVRIRDDKPPSEIDTLARVKVLAGDA